ncbi:DUF4240 domain-containing protein [Streptomyces sp. NPDC005408]|uniref:DUF4240 domain-containing protein n=1 Tax=Streptomyces sp. NPDC005408 TaxID=3155341 RepID=UPI0033A03345
MNVEAFWGLVESARGDSKPFAEALVGCLGSSSKTEILEFQQRFDELDIAAYSWDVWAAACLIGGGRSDDSFMDFCAGLIALGRDWYERALQSPDRLADHPSEDFDFDDPEQMHRRLPRLTLLYLGEAAG